MPIPTIETNKDADEARVSASRSTTGDFDGKHKELEGSENENEAEHDGNCAKSINILSITLSTVKTQNTDQRSASSDSSSDSEDSSYQVGSECLRPPGQVYHTRRIAQLLSGVLCILHRMPGRT